MTYSKFDICVEFITINKMDELIKTISSLAWRVQAVRNTAGLSYRQIKYWDEKGHIENNRASKKQWRKFLAKDIFGLQIGAELKKLGIPPIKTKWVLQQINDRTYLEYALQLYLSGIKVYFYSDLRKFMYIESTNSFSNKKPFLEKSPVVSFPITPILDAFFEILKLPSVPVEKGFKKLALTEKEINLINSVRDPKYGQISIKKTNKGLKIKGTQFLDKDALNEIAEQISKGKNCKITTSRDAHNKTTSAQIEEDIG